MPVEIGIKMNKHIDQKGDRPVARPADKPLNETRNPFGKPPTTQTDFARKSGAQNSHKNPRNR